MDSKSNERMSSGSFEGPRELYISANNDTKNRNTIVKWKQKDFVKNYVEDGDRIKVYLQDSKDVPEAKARLGIQPRNYRGGNSRGRGTRYSSNNEYRNNRNNQGESRF